ncbi:alpha/beta hydrolase [Tundrisphaera lichenicola]|uniref:alpha/beta hydrolase n=1 Tax=Tundrisphaera lichenicola TaxID=2029860 RepID=UPI003EB8CFAC
MRGHRGPWSKLAASTMALALMVVGAVVAQDNPAAKKAEAPANSNKAKSARKGRLLRAPGREPAKGVRKGADPLAIPADPNAPAGTVGQALPPAGTFRYQFKIAEGAGSPLAASYYPSKLGESAPVVLLVHERERSSKDFEEPIGDLKKLTLAESLQKEGYAVLAIDLRGHGSNPRKNLTQADWPAVVNDLQLAYHALVDRHNWGELNVAKLGVVALGEGANVAVHWAALGGGVSSEGRTSDLNSLVLISPMIDEQAQGLPIKAPITALAARVPIDLMVGERDAASLGLIDDGPASIKAIVKRQRNNQVDTFPSALHGYKLLRLEPNLTGTLTRFLDATIKSKGDDWEGRYLLNPVTYLDPKVVKHPDRTDPAATKKAVR